MSIRITKFGENKSWIDISSPSVEDLKMLIHQYKIPQHLVEDSIEVGHLPKFEFSEHFNFVITRFVHDFKINELKTIQEFTSKVAFIFHENQIITIHRLELEFLNNLSQNYLEPGLINSVNDLVELILIKILRTYETPAEDLSAKIDTLEEKIFLKQINNNLSKEFYIIKRESSSMKKLLFLTGDALKSMEKNGFKSKDFYGIKDLQTKLTSIVDQNIEDVSNLINLFYAISSQKTNDIVKTLTILSIFFMPLTFIAGIYGMNFEFMPELKWKYGYFFSLFIMTLVSIAIYKFFKKKKWF